MALEKAPYERIRIGLVFTLLLLVFWLSYEVVAPFLVGTAWALILALALWPVHRLLLRKVKRKGLSAFLMVLLITVAIVLPLGLAGMKLAGEAASLADDVESWLSPEGRKDLLESIGKIPMAGSFLEAKARDLFERQELREQYVRENIAGVFSFAQRIVVGLGRGIFSLLFCLFATYFFFRHGTVLADQLLLGAYRVGGDESRELVRQIRETVRGVVYGLVMTAIVQAILAALGFWVAGVRFPVLLGMLTLVLSFIPFGPPLVWLPASISLFLGGRTVAGALLFGWGAGVISTMDNILRPLFIGQATQMPVLLVFIAVLGGLMSFGLLGIFVGPAALAVLLTLWRRWLAAGSPARS
jgi:predicted PurR-regulated permease PerM